MKLVTAYILAAAAMIPPWMGNTFLLAIALSTTMAFTAGYLAAQAGIESAQSLFH